MEKKKLDWIISIIKEQMVTGSSAGVPGFSEKSPPEGFTAGMTPVMGLRRRKGPQIKLPPGSRKRWDPKKQSQ
jgi:hypothetical protein